MRLSAATVGMLLCFSLTLNACGGDRTTTADGTSSSVAMADRTGESTAPAPPSSPSCRLLLGPFVASLAALRDDLARGLSYDDYLAQVRGTRAVYARIHADRVPAGCLLTSGGPAERAFNLYIDAANVWGNCLATVSCSTRTVEPRLQRKWALAEDQIALAQRGLTPPRS